MEIKKVLIFVFILPLYLDGNREEFISYIRKNDLIKIQELSHKRSIGISQPDKDTILQATNEELALRKSHLSWKSPYRLSFLATGLVAFSLGFGSCIYEIVAFNKSEPTAGSFKILQGIGNMGSGLYFIRTSYTNELAKSEYHKAIAIQAIIQKLYGSHETLEDTDDIT